VVSDELGVARSLDPSGQMFDRSALANNIADALRFFNSPGTKSMLADFPVAPDLE
jgi:hypothetical protein